MYARRFLVAIVVLVVLGVAAAFALFQFGGSALTRYAAPQGHFAPPPVRSGPDYDLDANWLAKPGASQVDAEWVPVPADDAAPLRPAAVFYIHPTTYLERDKWNAAIDEGGDTAFRETLFLRSQASAFAGFGQIWAPRYRQAAFGAFLLKSDDARKALDLAYGDVLAAFDVFLKAQPDERPLILAGHSQGALHLARLLVDRRAELQGRLVAAYVAGWPLSLAADVPATRLSPCTVPDETGCILSWLSFGEPANADMMLDAWSDTEAFDGSMRKRDDLLCVNPLTGTKDGAADAAANPGTLVPTPDFQSATLLPGVVAARCDKGLLLINGALPPLGPYVLPGNNYHVYDYALFWAAIRDDAQRRLAAWR